MKSDSKATPSDQQDANDQAQPVEAISAKEEILSTESNSASIEATALPDNLEMDNPLSLEVDIPSSPMNTLQTVSPGDQNDQNDDADMHRGEGNTRHLYNDVTFEPDHLADAEDLEFSIQDGMQAPLPQNLLTEKSSTEEILSEDPLLSGKGSEFTAVEDVALLEQAIETIPAIHADPKLIIENEGEIRKEPQLRENHSPSEVHFSATDLPEETVATDAEEGIDESSEAVAQDQPPVKKQKGSKLGMGWFQGFSLFIAFLLFSALAVFAYFMLGDKPLYEGDVPKYVVIGNEDSGAMAALNPAIPEEVRQQYIYVPKVDRSEELALLQERPVLDTPNQDTKVTKVELASNQDGSEEVVISEEKSETHDNGLSLLSVDHNASGLSAEDLALVDGFLLQGDIAYEQGIYVGVNQDDAYYYYQSALALDPHNAKALQGISNIANIYYANARNAYNSGTYDVAGQYVALGLAVEPTHSALLQLQQLIEQMQSTQSSNMGASPNYDSFNFDF